MGEGQTKVIFSPVQVPKIRYKIRETAFLFSRADLVQYEKLSKSNAMYNLNHAFNLAEQEFGLFKLLDAEVLYHIIIIIS